MFIPTLALALGVRSGNSKAFEDLYITWWYTGPAHHTPSLEFNGTPAASNNTVPYLLAALALLLAAYWRRHAVLAYA